MPSKPSSNHKEKRMIYFKQHIASDNLSLSEAICFYPDYSLGLSILWLVIIFVVISVITEYVVKYVVKFACGEMFGFGSSFFNAAGTDE